METEEDLFEGTWLVIITPVGRFIGKRVDGGVHTTKDITLNPAIDFQCGLQQTPEGIVKGALCSMVDATTSPIPLHFDLTGCGLYYFKDMKDQDLVEYKKLVTNAINQAMQARAGRAGINLSGQMPGRPPHGSA